MEHAAKVGQAEAKTTTRQPSARLVTALEQPATDSLAGTLGFARADLLRGPMPTSSRPTSSRMERPEPSL